MEQYKNTWFIYQWFYEDGEDLIHPIDLERYKERFRYHGWCLFYCILEDKEYITFKYKKELFRVKPKLYKRVSMPIFSYGDYLKLKKYPNAICKVDDIRWHSDRSEPFYTLIVDGKKKLKRYYEEEFLLD